MVNWIRTDPINHIHSLNLIQAQWRRSHAHTTKFASLDKNWLCTQYTVHCTCDINKLDYMRREIRSNNCKIICFLFILSRCSALLSLRHCKLFFPSQNINLSHDDSRTCYACYWQTLTYLMFAQCWLIVWNITMGLKTMTTNGVCLLKQFHHTCIYVKWTNVLDFKLVGKIKAFTWIQYY